MSENIATFYDELAEQYHLIFEDWNRSIERQASVLGPLLEERVGPAPLRVLDCACGIGTQTIGIARRGHAVVASDLSEAAVRRAQREATERRLDVRFYVSDMRDLSSIPESDFDAVLVGDNALPHLLTAEDLSRAIKSIFSKLRPNGILLATIRDYDNLLQDRPTIQGPVFYSDNGLRRITHQIWDWHEDTYTVHLYLTWDSGSCWMAKHYATQYRAVRRQEFSASLAEIGFRQIEWLLPETTGFNQPILIARKNGRS